MTKYDNVRVRRIPLARSELRRIAANIDETAFPGVREEIEAVVDGLMTRKATQKRKALPRQNRITEDMVRDVLEHLKKYPAMSNRAIGRIYGIDGGRVSEIDQGLRTVDDPTMRRFR